MHSELLASTLFLLELIGKIIFDDKVQATILNLKKKLRADTGIKSFLKADFDISVSKIEAKDSSTFNR